MRVKHSITLLQNNAARNIKYLLIKQMDGGKTRNEIRGKINFRWEFKAPPLIIIHCQQFLCNLVARVFQF